MKEKKDDPRRENDQRRESALNRIKQVIGKSSTQQEATYDISPVFWPKVKDGLFLHEDSTGGETEEEGPCLVGEDETENDSVVEEEEDSEESC